VNKSIFWHDYETFGSDPRVDRPCQFAGIRTDEDLNEIEEPVVLWCQPAPDFLPHPIACRVTGITPQQALEKGVVEAEFCRQVLGLFSEPGTCTAGYNSLRFDDELSRHMFYRCFHDPYEREWKHGNSRWDLIDMLRATRALRPEGINWPLREDGNPSFRLEALTAANNIPHEGAHDALADVRATIAMAKLVREKQPRLYDYLYTNRQKNRLIPMLDLQQKTPVVHVSGMFPAARGCLGIVMPLMKHPRNNNGVVVLDLCSDPGPWLDLSAEEIAARLYARSEDLEEGEERVALKTVHLNRCPVLAPLSVLNGDIQTRYDIDLDSVTARREQVLAVRDLAARLHEVFDADFPASDTDPELQLYSGGFMDEHDKRLMQKVQGAAPASLAPLAAQFHDKRMPEMLFRYRARNWPDTLDSIEAAKWENWCRERLLGKVTGAGVSLTEFLKILEEAGDYPPGLRTALQEYAQMLALRLGLATAT
jgi:exodeoxyribonuclease-1